VIGISLSIEVLGIDVIAKKGHASHNLRGQIIHNELEQNHISVIIQCI